MVIIQKLNSLNFSILLIFLSLSLFNFGFTNAQIHRAKSPSSYYLKYDVNYTKANSQKQQDLINEDPIRHQYLTWMFSIMGILLVGLSGILPVAILPRLANNNDDLGTLNFK
jgi:hypothetical protein